MTKLGFRKIASLSTVTQPVGDGSGLTQDLFLQSWCSGLTHYTKLPPSMTGSSMKQNIRDAIHKKNVVFLNNE